MAQLLRALITLAEGQSSIPSTHNLVHTHHDSSSKEWSTFSPLLQAHMVHIHIYKQNSHTHKTNKIKTL